MRYLKKPEKIIDIYSSSFYASSACTGACPIIWQSDSHDQHGKILSIYVAIRSIEGSIVL